jgi:hypothetical protein
VLLAWRAMLIGESSPRADFAACYPNGSGFPENRAEAPRFGRRRSGRQFGGRPSLLFRGDDTRMLSRSRCSTGSSINSPNPMCRIEHWMIGIDPCL